MLSNNIIISNRCRLCLMEYTTSNLIAIFRDSDGSPKDTFSENTLLYEFLFRKLMVNMVISLKYKLYLLQT